MLHRNAFPGWTVAVVGAAAAAGLGFVASSAGPIVGVGGGLALAGESSKWVALGALLLLQAGTFLIWPSRWNAPAVVALSFSISAFVVPLIFIGELSEWPPPLVRIYLGIISLGAITLTVGLVMGNALTAHSRRIRASLTRHFDALSETVMLRRIWIAGVVAIAFLGGCFLVMGYMPLLASDPVAAKYLQGPYQITRKVAFAYHVAVPLASTTLLLVLGTAIATRRSGFAVLAAILGALLLATNQRGYAGTPLLACLMIAGAGRRIPLAVAVSAVLLVGPAGSAANYVLSDYLGYKQFERRTQGTSIVTAIAAGAPDVADTLHSLGNFVEAPQPTHGRTFYAGLSYAGNRYIPNPWALHLANPSVSDLSQVRSGGNRLPSPLWGYYAWGWWGAALVPLVSGVLLGGLIGAVKRFVTTERFLLAVVLTVPLLAIGSWFRDYDWFRISACIPAICIIWARARVRGPGMTR